MFFRKYWLYILLTISLLLVPAMGACGDDDDEDQVIELAFSTFLPATHHSVLRAHIPWIEEIESETNGRVQIQLIAGEAAGKAADQVQLLLDGAVDIAQFGPTYTAGRFPLSSVMELPFPAPDVVSYYNIHKEVNDEYLADEYEGIHALWLADGEPSMIITKDKQVKVLEDLQGLKLRVYGGLITKAVEMIGATAVAMPSSEIYEGMQRGTVDGAVWYTSSVPAYSLEEVGNYITEIGLNGAYGIIGMNEDVWDSLPNDIQRIFTDVSEKYGLICAQSYMLQREDALVTIEAAGVELYTPPASEIQRWRDATASLYDQYVTDMEALGLPGEEALEAFRDAQK